MHLLIYVLCRWLDRILGLGSSDIFFLYLYINYIIFILILMVILLIFLVILLILGRLLSNLIFF
jgi:hypothetical protein